MDLQKDVRLCDVFYYTLHITHMHLQKRRKPVFVINSEWKRTPILLCSPLCYLHRGQFGPVQVTSVCFLCLVVWATILSSAKPKNKISGTSRMSVRKQEAGRGGRFKRRACMGSGRGGHRCHHGPPDTPPSALLCAGRGEAARPQTKPSFLVSKRKHALCKSPKNGFVCLFVF